MVANLKHDISTPLARSYNVCPSLAAWRKRRDEILTLMHARSYATLARVHGIVFLTRGQSVLEVMVLR